MKMGTVSGVSKYRNRSLNTIEELEEYFENDNEEYDIEDDEIILFSNGCSQLWVTQWFHNEYKDSVKGNGDYKILTKEVINRFIDYCQLLLKNGYGEYVDRFDFNSNDDNEESNFEKVTIEICDTRDEFEKLLNQDFENNTIVYWEVMGV